MDQGQLLFKKIASLKRDPLAKEQSFEPKKKKKTAYGNYTYIMA
jgi:hypothetical protein